MTKLNGGLSWLLSADEDAVSGWPVIVHDMHTRRFSLFNLVLVLVVVMMCAADCRKVLHEAEVEKKLVGIVSQDKSVTVQQSAVLALAVMAENEASCDAIRKCGT